jgi:hypothetical protein
MKVYLLSLGRGPFPTLGRSDPAMSAHARARSGRLRVSDLKGFLAAPGRACRVL